MPIKAENLARYPKNWREIRQEILERAGNRCEQCGVPNHVYRIVGTSEWSADEDAAYLMAAPTARVTRIALTCAHLDHSPENNGEPGNRPNIRALCQKCHLAYDHDHHMRNAHATRRSRKAAKDLFA